MITAKDTGLAWFTALCSGDVDTTLSLMADDFRYCLPGTLPTAGWKDREGFFETAQMLPRVLAGPLTMRIGDVTAEDERVWIEAEAEAPLAAGGTYANCYVIALRVIDGRVAEMKEFCDNLPVFEAIDGPATRGPRQSRQSPLTTITACIHGPAVPHG